VLGAGYPSASADSGGETVLGERTIRGVDGSAMILVSTENSIKHTWQIPCSMDLALPHHGQSYRATTATPLSGPWNQRKEPDGTTGHP
jgi:hypothetical protein